MATALDHHGLGALAFIARTIGASGVELFFVLSGLVLTRPYISTGRPFRTREYFQRRAERLFPPYLLAWLMAGALIYATSTHPTWWTELAALPRFEFPEWIGQVAILSLSTIPYSFVWWSLRVEVMFYLIVPLLIPVMRALTDRASVSVALLAACAALALVLPVVFPGLHASPADVGQLLVYLPCFAAGLLLARAQWPKSVAIAVGAAGVALLALAYKVPSVQPHVGYGLLYSAIVSRSLDRQSLPSRMLGGWHLVWLGERSYSLFLVHGLVIVATYYIGSMLITSSGGTFILVTRLIAAPLSLLVAMLSFHFIERRFARGLATGESFWPKRPKPRTLLPAAA